jgi:hypothetical protein
VAADSAGRKFRGAETVTSEERRDVLRAFKAMYEAKRFERHLFDTDLGYLQTTLSNDARMPLDFFVEYNNRWWFPLLSRVAVPCIGYDPETDTGAIVLAIHYTETDVLHAAQYVEFGGDKIHYIRTYASPTFFDRDHDLIRLDRFGNTIWLSTGYDLHYSAKAALLFFDSPVGQAFARNQTTRRVVEEIVGQVTELLASRRGKP